MRMRSFKEFHKLVSTKTPGIVTHCRTCGQYFTKDNVFSETGWERTQEDGLCEICRKPLIDKAQWVREYLRGLADNRFVNNHSMPRRKRLSFYLDHLRLLSPGVGYWAARLHGHYTNESHG